MLVSSSQSSTQRPLGLSVEELFALDRQYRRLEQQQQQQHLAQLQAQAHLTSSNLNRLASRSLDLVSSSSSTPLTVLPSLEVHGRGLVHRPPLSHPSAGNYPRSHSIDQLRYAPPPPPPLPPPPPVRHTYQQHQQHRFAQNDISHQHHQPRHRSYLQHPVMATSTTPSLGVMYDAVPPSSNDNFDSRVSCKLRRQQPIKRESSRRIVVRPVVQRRREPSISSSCESLDEPRSPLHRFSTHQPDVTTLSVPFTPSASLIADVIADLNAEENRNFSKDDSFSDESDVNLYEMRVPIGKTYDTSDISVQLEGPKILIHCHTIEPTDKRGNYRKHEFKTELFVPDVVDDETIVAYLTEDGELIVEGKYQPWAWKEIKKTRQIEQKTLSSPVSPPPIISPPPSTSARNDGGVEQGRISPSLISNNSHNNNSRMINNNNNNNNATMNRIEILDNNRTVIHVGESPQSQPPPPPPLQFNDPRSVSDIISRFNTLNTTTSTLWDGQYSFTTDIPPVLIYHLRLPFETLMDTVRVQSDPQMNSLRIFIEQQERSSSQQQQQQQQQNKVVIRSTSRLCRLPRDRSYDFARLRVTFLKDNFIRIELPTLF